MTTRALTSFFVIGSLHAMQAQTVYDQTLPQMQGVNLQNWTTFSFPGTPNTVGGATITFDWLACYQGGFGTNGVEMRIRVGASNYVTVLDYTGGTLDCTFQPRTVTITPELMQDALAYTGGSALEGQVRVDDACQPGVGCAFYNDPVIRELTLTYTVSAADFTSPDPTKCPGEVVQFSDASINAPTSHSWSFPGGDPSTSDLPSPVVQYTTPGQYDVSLTVVTSDGESTVTKSGFVTIHPLPLASAGADQFLCEGESVQLQAGGGVSYQWTPITGLSDPDVMSPVATPAVATTYTVLVTSAQGCQANDQVLVQVVPAPVPAIDTGNGQLCAGDSLELVATGAQFYTWSPNLFISSTSGSTVEVWPAADQTWTVTGTDAFGCVGESAVTITVVPAAMTPSITWAEMVLSTEPATSYQWYLDGEALEGATQQSWSPTENGNYTVVTTDDNGCSAESAIFQFGSVGFDPAQVEAPRAYPQPARGLLHVVGVNIGSSFRLLDAQGRVVRSGVISSSRTDLDVRGQAPGVYVFEAIDGNERLRLPVVME
ncbi:MAG TPA: PKD domain-containing protein [Flavobacteriales bacterium]|nr:PKD domain-containing protein [Flavobacteriales bacterium]HNU56348.1 PKD domain-containing protein [Flavobacteriales bacterium]